TETLTPNLSPSLKNSLGRGEPEHSCTDATNNLQDHLNDKQSSPTSFPSLFAERGSGGEVLLPISLKWPNDVLLSGRKLAGILPEAICQGEALTAVILGIGLNIRVDFTGTGLEDRSTSLEPAVGSSIDRTELLARLLHQIDYWAMRVNDAEL